MNYTRFHFYTILLLYHDFIFCVHLAVVQTKNCGGGCKFCAPAKGFAKRSIDSGLIAVKDRRREQPRLHWDYFIRLECLKFMRGDESADILDD